MKRSKASQRGYWDTATGLQKVDGLEVSPFLLSLAKANIEGKLSLKEGKGALDSYYASQETLSGTKEADYVSLNAVSLLEEKDFELTSDFYLKIHRRLFADIYDHAGKIRELNIAKAEWVLNGRSVAYASSSRLLETLEYDLSKERRFDYDGLNEEEAIPHLSSFIADLWQIHPFYEGNTRTCALFLLKYCKSLCYQIRGNPLNNIPPYFRNCLARANYEDRNKGIKATNEYLETFLRSLLLGEKRGFRNGDLRIK